jgi:plastocyanin
MKKSVISKSRLFLSITFLAAIMSFSNSCSKSSAYNTPTPPPGTKGGPGVNEVWIQGLAFNPATITVNAGTTITWTNKDATTHTVTSDTDLFNSGNIGSNEAFSHTFSTTGTFPYHCSIHTFMTATVVVK